jgi:TetR/AcrR family transcriptional regulator, multidrug resistance operon repressor
MRPKDEEKFDAIARATYALVERSGLSGLTMAEIAKAAGIATGTLYLYYPSKEDLINRLYERAKTATGMRMREGMDPQAPYRSRFRQVWVNFVKNRVEHFQEALLQEQYYNSPWFSEESRALSARIAAEWMAFLEEGKKQEMLKNVPSHFLAAAILGSVREVANLIRTKVVDFDDATINTAFGLCWDGVRA